MTQAWQATSSSVQEAAAALRRARCIAVMAHVNPDADAIGSVLGLAMGLRDTGKDVVAALSDRVPDYARFLRGSDQIVSNLGDQEFDLLVCLDAADIERVGSLYLEDRQRFSAVTVLNIDHHRTNPQYGVINYVDASASSTSELVFRLLTVLDAPVRPETATALLFGIVGDTGAFRNGATTPGALETAAKLLTFGADNQRIAFQLFECKRFVAARLWGRIVSTIELDQRRHIVFACLSQEMLLSEGATVDETEGVAEYLRGIEEAEVVMLMKETDSGEMRISMRSRPTFDVAAIATVFEGGGHQQAAGCTIPGPYSSAKAALTDAFDRLYPQ